MRYPASEKLEIIRIVEKSHLPVRRILDKLGIPRATFYRWYDLFRLGGIAALENHRPLRGHVWNRVSAQLLIGLLFDRRKEAVKVQIHAFNGRGQAQLCDPQNWG